MEIAKLVFLLHLFVECYGQNNLNAPLNTAYDCVNPNNNKGLCLSLHFCPTLVNITGEATENKKFIEDSSCSNGYGPYPFVCCSNEIGFSGTATVSTPASPTLTSRHSLLASSEECTGRYSIYSYASGIADIRDYHWTAILGHITNDTFKYSCIGSLISHRYILTSGTCGTWNSYDDGLTRVARLGEYDQNERIDCAGDICLDPVLDVPIEEVIVHSEYVERPLLQYDIALVRLSRNVDYNKNIAPICLPSTVGFAGSNAGEGSFVTGWGEGNQIKVEANLPIADQQNCSTYFYEERGFYLFDYQLCAGGLGDGSCHGDAGVPLMKKYQSKWLLEGISSLRSSCGVQGWYDVFTRVSSFENWILANIKL